MEQSETRRSRRLRARPEFASRRAARAAGVSFVQPAGVAVDPESAAVQTSAVEAAVNEAAVNEAVIVEVAVDAVPAVETPETVDVPTQADSSGKGNMAPAEVVARRKRSKATHTARVASLVALAVPTLLAPVFGVLPTLNPAPVAAVERTVPVASGPSALDVLTAPQLQDASLLIPVSSVSQVDNVLAQSSRSLVDRTPLPGCDAVAVTSSPNGLIPASQLCYLDFSPVDSLRADAAIALTELNEAFHANFGYDLCLIDSYRSLSEQYASKYKYGFMAATPGTSNHGYGLAIDLCDSITYNSATINWLRVNGPTFGWENPDWAIPGTASYQKYEPWHWEFTDAVADLGNSFVAGN